MKKLINKKLWEQIDKELKIRIDWQTSKGNVEELVNMINLKNDLLDLFIVEDK